MQDLIFERHRVKINPEPSSPSTLMDNIFTQVSAEITDSVAPSQHFSNLWQCHLGRCTGTTLKIRSRGVD
jgi:hypothetical protein